MKQEKVIVIPKNHSFAKLVLPKAFRDAFVSVTERTRIITFFSLENLQVSKAIINDPETAFKQYTTRLNITKVRSKQLDKSRS